MTLYPFDVANGLIGVLALVISFYVAIRILIRGIEFKEKNLILVGITGIFISEPWWPSVISFLLEASIGIRLPNPVAHVIGIVLQPIGIFTWLAAFTDLVYKKWQKPILLLFLIHSIIFEITFFIVFAHDPSLEGTFYGINSALIPMGFMLTFLIIILTTGLLFARESVKAESQEIKTKGRLIAFAIVSFSIAAAIDAIILLLNLFLFLQLINRIILISSAIAFYGGFLLPEWMKKIFIKT
jgi:hypothetical protein